MPIKVTCQCGKSFAAKDELAGKAVKCPNCQQPLRIPAAGIAAPLPSAAPAPPARPAAPAPQANVPVPSAGSVFDEIGLKAAPAGSNFCPGCAQPIAPNAVICIKCGYNFKLGRRMQTVSMGAVGGGEGGGHGHGVNTSEMMNRAAGMIEEDKEAERSKTREGLPWWVYLLGLIFVSGFVVLMMIIPQNQAILAAGGLVLMIGVLVSLYAWIRICMIAFNENIGFGLMVLFLGCIGFLVFTVIRWEKCGSYFLMWLAAQFIQGIGYGAIILGQSLKGGGDNFGEGQDDVYLPPPREPSIVLSICDAEYRGWRTPAFDRPPV